jgi:hypothetical protein
LKKWSADFCNNPHDDYNLIVELLCDDEEVAIIRRADDRLEMRWYPTPEEIIVPVEWLNGLLAEAARRL